MSPRELLSRLSGLASSRIAGATVGFFSQLLLTRYVPADQVGAAALGMSATAFFALIANGGIAMLAQTELPRFAVQKRFSTMAKFHRVALQTAGLTFCMLAAAVLLAVWIFPLSTGQRVALVFGLACAPAAIIMRYTSSVASSERRFQLAYFPDFLFRPSAFLVCLLLLVLWGALQSSTAVLGAFAFVTFGTALGQLAFSNSWITTGQRQPTPRKRFVQALRIRASYLTLVAAVQFAFADIVILVAGLLVTEHQLAIVSVASRLAALVGFVLHSAQMLAIPDLAGSVAGGDRENTRDILKRTSLVTVALSAAALGGTYLLGKFVLGLFGEVYEAGSVLLVLLVVGQVLRAGTGMDQQLLAIAGRQKQMAISCILALLTFIVASNFLAGAMGIVGIGLAVVAAEFAWKAAVSASRIRT